jgi:hypothetical protein
VEARAQQKVGTGRILKKDRMNDDPNTWKDLLMMMK